ATPFSVRPYALPVPAERQVEAVLAIILAATEVVAGRQRQFVTQAMAHPQAAQRLVILRGIALQLELVECHTVQAHAQLLGIVLGLALTGDLAEQLGLRRQLMAHLQAEAKASTATRLLSKVQRCRTIALLAIA